MIEALIILATSVAATAHSSPLAVRIPAGTFTMGCVAADQRCEPTELPRRAVTLTQPFWLARTETTVGQFHKFVAATNFRTEADKRGQGRFWRFDINEWDWIDGLSWRAPFAADQPAPDNWPAVQIAWADADAYCRWAGGRLPTEAEWERAARGGVEGQISVWGNAPSPMVDGVAQANTPDRATAREFSTFSTFADYDDGFARIAPAASFAPNAYGLYDMAGNVYEWTSDWIVDGPYPSGPVTDPRGIEAGEIKAVRGAGWGYPPEQFRISFRGIAGLDFWTATFGFRCAWDHNPNSITQGR